MDLVGSLIDTKLRIYPSSNLVEFLKTLPIDDNVPTNIIKLVKGEDYEIKHTKNVEDIKIIPIHFNNEDIENLNKIKATCKIEVIKNAEGFEDETKQKDLKAEDPHINNDSESFSHVVTSKAIKKSTAECNGTLKMSEHDDDNKNMKMSNKVSNDKSKQSKEECNEKLKEESSVEKGNDDADKEELYLTTFDIDWLYSYLQKSKSKGKSVPYLHELLYGTEVKPPPNKVIKRNPVLEARCVKLRAQQEAREYRKMTKSVDNVRMRFPEDSISFQLKQVNRHLIAIGQFILSIFAGFLFGFKGVDWMVGPLDFGFRLLMGVMCALIISLAEIYFLAKKLNEELNVPETVQLGGPPKFAEKQKYEDNVQNRAIDKEHQD